MKRLYRIIEFDCENRIHCKYIVSINKSVLQLSAIVFVKHSFLYNFEMLLIRIDIYPET